MKNVEYMLGFLGFIERQLFYEMLWWLIGITVIATWILTYLRHGWRTPVEDRSKFLIILEYICEKIMIGGYTIQCIVGILMLLSGEPFFSLGDTEYEMHFQIPMP